MSKWVKPDPSQPIPDDKVRNYVAAVSQGFWLEHDYLMSMVLEWVEFRGKAEDEMIQRIMTECGWRGRTKPEGGDDE